MSANDFDKPQQLQWFVLESYVHVSIKKNTALLYNPYTGKFLHYENNLIVLKIIKKLETLRNLRVILLKHKELTDPIIAGFINDVRTHFMGDLLPLKFSKGKPLSMPPVVKIQKDVKYLKRDSVRSLGENVMNYLDEITLHITDLCSENCDICSSAFRQFLCCGKNRSKQGELKLEKIIDFLEELKGVSTLHLNIAGGNILKHSQFERLLEYLTHWNSPIAFTIHYLNLGRIDVRKENEELVNDPISYISKLKSNRKNQQRVEINIPITFPLNEEILTAAMKRIQTLDVDYHFSFLVENLTHIEHSYKVLSDYPVEEPIVHAFYNGKNLDFFKENIYIHRQSIENARPTLKDIYINQTVNPRYFGKLTVLSSGKVYANVNEKFLGIIGKESVYEMLMKEMRAGRSWRHIRKNVKPCRDCVYQALCPPISNYANAIGKPNLCFRD